MQVECLLKEITDLSAQGLTGDVVAISFCRRLTQPIQERVHPAFEYWGHRDPTRGHEHKVPRDEIANLVARIMVGQIRDKGWPKAHCLKRPTDAVSLVELCRVVLFTPSCFLCFCSVFPSAHIGLYNNSVLLQAKVLEYWSLLLCLRGTLGRTPLPPSSCASRRRRRLSSPPTPPWGASRIWRLPEPRGRRHRPP